MSRQDSHALHDDSQLLDELEREIGADTGEPSRSIYQSTHTATAQDVVESPVPRKHSFFGVDNDVAVHSSARDDVQDLSSSATPQPYDSLRRGRLERHSQASYDTHSAGLQSTLDSTLLRSSSASPPPELLDSESLRDDITPRRQPSAEASVMRSSTRSKGKERARDPPSRPPPPSPPKNRRQPTTIEEESEQDDERSEPFIGGEIDEEAEGLIEGGRRRLNRRRKNLDPARALSEREKALWTWVNVVDLDGYLQEVYEYYAGKGIYCIATRRLLNVLTSGFVIIFSTFLFSCIDFGRFPKDGEGLLRDVIIDKCISRWSLPHVLLTWLLGGFFAWQLVTFSFGLPKLLDMKRFYEHLLDIPNHDISTISWPEIVRRIGEIRQENPVTSVKTSDGKISESWVGDETNLAKLDVHDVANRIMRQENYLIALFNKDLLDLRVRVPLPGPLVKLVPHRRVSIDPHGRPFIVLGQQGLTKALEWNLRYCLMGHLFDHRGRVRKDFVRGRRRGELAEQLSRRFVFMGILNAIFAPFIVIYILMYSFFRYFEEYHKNPSSIGSRQYTLYAKWLFREYNELPHLFERRLDESYSVATKYINQFPKEINAIVMRFVAFISGAFAAVLLLLSVIDPVFLRFQITQDRTVLFYLGLFTSILAVARGMIPEGSKTFDPESLMSAVIAQTHYMADPWKGNLHAKKVHGDFGKLFDMKLSVFLQEVLSVLVTPFILWYSLPLCAPDIVDFFREFTIHVDGIGYVCSFAVFDFKRQGNIKTEGTIGGPPAPASSSTPTSTLPLLAREGKMEKSLLHFKITNPDWQPADASASQYLSRVAEEDSPQNRSRESITPTEPGARSVAGDAALSRRRTGKHNVDSSRPPLNEQERKLKEKSMIYERALQRSIMLKSTSGGSIFGPGANSMHMKASRAAETFSRQEQALARLRGQAPPASRLPPPSPAHDVREDNAGWEMSGVRRGQDDVEEDLEQSEGKGVLGLIGQAMKKG